MQLKHLEINNHFCATGCKILSILIILAFITTAKAQVAAPAPYSTNTLINNVRSWDASKPDTNGLNFGSSTSILAAKMTNQYLDGFGRQVQTVIRRGSLATGTPSVDLVSAATYDGFGREPLSYLPFASVNTGGIVPTSDGSFKINSFQQDSVFTKAAYIGESWYYGQTNSESSVLGRTTESFAPGNNWAGTSGQSLEVNRHSIKSKYWFNKVSDSVRIWSVTDIAGNFGNYSSAAAYPVGMLYKNITIDENGKQVIVFKDKLGKTILSKVQLTSVSDTGTGKGHSGWLCTYYIYDALGNLRCVIQPRGVELILSNWILTDVTILAEQCFRYEYDYHNRLVMKKIPGSGKICMVYDARNRLVLEQDSLMRFSHKWLYTLYDSLNRPATTGLITDNANYSLLSYHAVRADTSISYPNVALYTNEELTKIFYDDYTWLSNYTTGLTSALDNTVNGTGNTNLFTASNTVWPYPQLINQSSQLKGMVTGTRIKVLGTGTYMYSVNFYDDKGRNVQIKSTNIATGVDITTTQYSWPGQPLMTIQKQEKAVTNAQTIVSVTRLTYDSLWRVSKTEKKISHSQVNGGSMPSAWIAISENEYNSIGQLKKKKLESTYNGGAGLDSLVYDYNIRGWLLGMNRNFAKDANNNNYFGFDLGYDKANNNIIGNQLYTTPQFNGNIEGMVWKSKGDNEKRKYDFSYDAADRILAADFNQYTSGTFNKTAQLDFSLSGMSYDANGNILKMKQRGLKLSSSYTIDTLNYNYISKSNKLLNVIDGLNDPLTKLGDFRTATTHPNYGNKISTTTDYTYDANGNLQLDYNKGLANIHYNYLNLPDSITVTGKGTIKYIYDATGNKLKKITTEGAATTATLYLPGSVYQNDTLQFISQEEGRVRMKSNTALVYDYFIKDHLGNVRIMLTDDRDTASYPVASLETSNLTAEKWYYAGEDSGRVNKSGVSGYPSDTYTNPNDFIQQLSGSGFKIGTSIVLKVMSGDKYNLRVSSWYKKNGTVPATPVSPLTPLISALVNSIGVVTNAAHGATATELQNSGALVPGAVSFYSSHNTADSTTKPKAFVNWILFDEQFKYVAASSGFEQVGADNVFTSHVKNNLDISKNGYLYIYVSNETPNINVYFDNLQVTHIKGAIMEETHYYPFGLVQAGISSKAAGSLDNDIKFNGKEFNEDLDLDWYEYGFRNNFDPQLGRFHSVDPLASDYPYYTPYQFAGNQPTIAIDVDGLEPAFVNDIFNWLVPKAVENPNGAAAKTIGVVAGVGKFAEKTITGLGNLVTNPPDLSPQGLANSGVQLGLEVNDRINTIQNGSTTEKTAAVTETVLDVTSIVAGTKGAGAALKTETTLSNIAKGLPDNATVVRGGMNTVKTITEKTGTHPSGVTGVSVECATCSVKELSKNLPNNKIGVTTVGEVRAAGGDVIKTSGRSPNHATLTGLPAEKTSKLLNPPINNPNKR